MAMCLVFRMLYLYLIFTTCTKEYPFKYYLEILGGGGGLKHLEKHTLILTFAKLSSSWQLSAS